MEARREGGQEGAGAVLMRNGEGVLGCGWRGGNR